MKIEILVSASFLAETLLNELWQKLGQSSQLQLKVNVGFDVTYIFQTALQ